MPTMLLLLLQTSPDQCFLTGICGLVAPYRPIAPGVMFVALGLVSFGVWGLRRRRRVPTPD